MQFERVRVIYKYALDRIPKHQAQELFKNYTMFEKKFGDRRGIEDVIVSKRRFQYEEEVKVSVLRNYVWKSVESGTKEEDGFIFLVYRFNALIGLFSLYWCKKQNRLRIWGFRLIVNLQVLCHLLCCLGKLRGK